MHLHSGSADFDSKVARSLRLSSSPKMRNYLLLLALAGARACTPGTTFGSQKCCPDGTESPYYNGGGVGYACSLVVGMTAASKI